MNVDNRVSTLVNVMNTLLDRFAPWKKSRKTATWYNKNIKSQINKQNKLFKNWLQEKTDENRESYKKQRNIVTKTIEHEKRKFYDALVEADKTKKSLFQAYQTICNTKRSNICNVEPNILNNFFCKNWRKSVSVI